MITDRRLQIFVKVVECGGFTAAAHSLKMSQPAVSQSVAQLEAEVGESLLLRGANPLKLTDKGRVLHSYALRILSLYESMAAELSGSEVLPERTTLSLGDGRAADISVRNGKIEIDLK